MESRMTTRISAIETEDHWAARYIHPRLTSGGRGPVIFGGGEDISFHERSAASERATKRRSGDIHDTKAHVRDWIRSSHDRKVWLQWPNLTRGDCANIHLVVDSESPVQRQPAGSKAIIFTPCRSF